MVVAGWFVVRFAIFGLLTLVSKTLTAQPEPLVLWLVRFTWCWSWPKLLTLSSNRRCVEGDVSSWSTAGSDRHHPSPGRRSDLFGMDLSRYGITKQCGCCGSRFVIDSSSADDRQPQRGEIPRGLRNFIEPILLFIRDEVLIPNMGQAGLKYLPFLWTVFFFILACNLIGLVPGGATATANISVTAALAILSFLATQFAGIRQNGVHYFTSLVPGVPWWLWPLMLVVELIGLVAKPFALAIDCGQHEGRTHRALDHLVLLHVQELGRGRHLGLRQCRAHAPRAVRALCRRTCSCSDRRVHGDRAPSGH